MSNIRRPLLNGGTDLTYLLKKTLMLKFLLQCFVCFPFDKLLFDNSRNRVPKWLSGMDCMICAMDVQRSVIIDVEKCIFNSIES